MRIVISSGHGQKIRGASGYLDEVNEARRVVDQVAANLRSAGVEATVFHDNTSTTQSQNLQTITNFHNSKSRDYDVSVHFNAYKTTSNPMGTECLYVTQSSLAAKVSGAIAKAGEFINRGAKKRTDLYFLNNTKMPAILIEVCFVDSSSDADRYRRNFEKICIEIASAISGVSVPSEPKPPEPTEPPEPKPPEPPANRVEVEGNITGDVQVIVNGSKIQGDPDSPNTVNLFITLYGDTTLIINGEEFHNTLPRLTADQKSAIINIANNSAIAKYNWKNRGVAPIGYIRGMALSFGQSLLRHSFQHPAILEMAKANTRNDDKDALSWYNSNFKELGMNNDTAGVDTLRHLYMLLLGLGMRESSGKHCEGRDMSASNVTSNTAEAGLFQTSYDANTCSQQFNPVMNEYITPVDVDSFLSDFATGVSCSDSSWKCYGSGTGYEFQLLCKNSPAFAVESCALVLRNLRKHYGPINRKDAELRKDADLMFQAVQDYLTGAYSLSA